MRLLLDTHMLLWFMNNDPRLGAHAEIIANPANHIFVSTVSLMEIAVKIRAGKLRVELPDLLSEIERQGFDLLPLNPHHVLELAKLPIFPDHKDPFDHQLIGQAIAEDMPFLSQDPHAGRYPVKVPSP